MATKKKSAKSKAVASKGKKSLAPKKLSAKASAASAKNKKAAQKAAAILAKAQKAMLKAKLAEQKKIPVPPKKPVLVVPKNGNTKQYTQNELIECLQACCGFISKRDAREFYDSFASMIQGALKNGYKLMLPGLGKMQVRKTKARNGINPMTKAPIKIPAKRKVVFTATKALKQAVL